MKIEVIQFTGRVNVLSVLNMLFIGWSLSRCHDWRLASTSISNVTWRTKTFCNSCVIPDLDDTVLRDSLGSGRSIRPRAAYFARIIAATPNRDGCSRLRPELIQEQSQSCTGFGDLLLNHFGSHVLVGL